jgi:membrane-bound metal-dependent hydrolase YbcI (DUF457 family)
LPGIGVDVTTVGHSLIGIAIAALTLPQAQTRRWYFFIGAGFVFFANLPDYPLPGWGHNSYLVSHSIFVTALLAALLGLLLLWPTFQAGVGKRVLVAWSAAWFSHMLLDSMYNHGQGIAIFWPLSDAHLAMPVSWFETIRLPAKSEHNLRVFAIEAMVFGAALLGCIGVRHLLSGDGMLRR